MSTKVTAPGPTPQETALQQAQLDQLNQQSSTNKALFPLELQAMGLASDGKGGYRQMTPDELTASMTPQQRQMQDLNNSIMSREQQALNGTLPIDPNLQADISQQQGVQEQALASKLGDNWRTTTSGMQSMGLFNKNADLIRAASARGDMTTAQSMLSNNLGLSSGLSQTNLANMQNANAPSMGLFSQYGAALQPYQYQRGLEYQANMQSAANQAGLISGAMGMVGRGIGAYFGA